MNCRLRVAEREGSVDRHGAVSLECTQGKNGMLSSYPNFHLRSPEGIVYFLSVEKDKQGASSVTLKNCLQQIHL